MKNNTKYLALSLLAMSLVFVNGCSQTSTLAEKKTETLQGKIIKSPVDKRQYAYMELENGMRFVLVSDPEATQSAAALAVEAGSFQEPLNQQGLAHYLEHMLFLGTDKYPDPDEYGKFVAQYGGSSNAYTASDHTNYVVTVDNVAFDEALARFSDFFKSPTLDPQYSDKERHAVHSEWTLRSPNDSVIKRSLSSRLLNPKHPAQHFNWGNLDSLKDKPDANLNEQMLEFYQTWYSANLMNGVLMSDLPIDKLKQLARQYFSDIPNHNTPEPEITADAFTPEQQGTLVHLVPQKDQKHLSIEFPITDNIAQFKSKPNAYLSYLINSEMPGTANAILRQQGLAEYIRSSALEKAFGNSGVFNIEVALTDKGVQNRDQVMAIIVAYLDKLKTEGVSERYFEEIQTSLNNDFRFIQKRDPMSEAWGIAANMMFYPIENVLNNSYSFETFSPQAIQQVLNQLDLHRARVWYIDQQQPHNQDMQYFKGQYQLEKLSEQQLKKWQAMAQSLKVELPAVNTLLPENFDIAQPQHKGKPVQLLNQTGLELWFAQSTTFDNQPKGYIALNLNSGQTSDSAANQVQTAMLLDAYLFDNLAVIEEASAAGMNFDLNDNEGLSLVTSGFDDKQPALLLSQIQHLKQYRVSDARLAITKEKFIRNLKNKPKSAVLDQLFPYFRKLTTQSTVSDEKLLAAAQKVTTQQVNEHLQALLDEANLRMMIFGNYSSKQAINIAHDIRQLLPVKGKMASNYQAKKLVPVAGNGLTFNRDVTLTDVGLLDTYIFPDASIQRKAAIELLSSMIKQPMFDQIRTQEQLAYAVGAFDFSLDDRAGLAFYAQTPKKGPAELMARFENFRSTFATLIKTFPQQKFDAMKQALLNELKAPPKNLAQEASTMGKDWRERKYSFDSKQQFIQALEYTSLDHVRRLYQDIQNPDKVMHVMVQLRGTAFADKDYEQGKGLKILQSLEQFKQEYYPQK